LQWGHQSFRCCSVGLVFFGVAVKEAEKLWHCCNVELSGVVFFILCVVYGEAKIIVI